MTFGAGMKVSDLESLQKMSFVDFIRTLHDLERDGYIRVDKWPENQGDSFKVHILDKKYMD